MLGFLVRATVYSAVRASRSRPNPAARKAAARRAELKAAWHRRYPLRDGDSPQRRKEILRTRTRGIASGKMPPAALDHAAALGVLAYNRGEPQRPGQPYS
jgi:hypothetical protein